MIANPKRIPTSPFHYYSQGAFFGVLQICLFLTVQCFLTATASGYFVVVLGWLTGLVLFLNLSKVRSQTEALTVAIVVYYIHYLFLSQTNIPIVAGYGLTFIASMLSALPAAYLFRNGKQEHSATFLFFNENNGFILGYLITFLGFMKFGNRMLQWAPLVFFVINLCTCSGLVVIAVLANLILGLLGLFTKNFSLTLSLIVNSALSIATALYKPSTATPGPQTQTNLSVSPRTTRVILCLAGFNLIVLQFMISREFSSIIAASELSIILIACMYFVGVSFGYAFNRVIKDSWMIPLAVLMYSAHFAILTFTKLFAGAMMSAGLGYFALLILLMITSLLTSSFYAVFLPRFIENTQSQSLEDCYTSELYGSIAGIGFIILVSTFLLNVVLLVYLTIFLALIGFLIQSQKKRILIVSLCSTVLLFHIAFGDSLYQSVTEDYYVSRGFRNAELLYSGHSFYHGVDVIESKVSDSELRKASFLNGVKYFDTTFDMQSQTHTESSLSEFTYFLAEVPAKYMHAKLGRKLDILILGGGSLYSISRVARYSQQTDLVEIDPLVIQTAKSFWQAFNHFDQIQNVKIILDDAKKYVRTINKQYDLVILDISAPYYLGTALIHNTDLFQLIRPILKPDGLFSESTQGRPKTNRPKSQGMRILKSFASAFPKYTVVDTHKKPRGEHGYLYAHLDADLDPTQVKQILETDGYLQGTKIFSHNDIRDLEKTDGFTLNNMEHLLEGNANRMKDRLSRNRNRHKNHWQAFFLFLLHSNTFSTLTPKKP